MPRRRSTTTSAGSAAARSPRKGPSDGDDDWEYEPTRGEVYRDRARIIVRFLWDTTKLTLLWLSVVWVAAHAFDEWTLRDAKRALARAEALAPYDLNGARDAYAVALEHLQRAAVREKFSTSVLAAGSRIFRLPVLFLVRDPWASVERQLIQLAQKLRTLASVVVPETDWDWERR